ncbi:LacI family DNA-binding transcriptional regulator [Subtercola lobariae]|uniref:LacI family transcriptional regulator n=1 Tax=Subtercola lobariae TaxID=1588641 RepID=A0A917EXP1_9MICO|nr:LacI family DNA-binding transcriptional regulator [Subtercola lobariae]GGF19599.1 LacI family transcriptional regulator [Subtercola lobariae]
MSPADDVSWPRAATLADVASAAGVAISTVSRALSNPARVNSVTRERIEQAARDLDYSPNSQARALISGRTRAVAVFVADVTNPFYFDLIRGTQRQLKAAGYTQVLVDTEESDELEDLTLQKLRRSFDGAILAASRLTDARLAALSHEVPMVTINRQTKSVPSVFIDTPSGILQAVEHLISLGHRKIAYISGPETSWPNEGRWRAFVRATERHGVEPQRIGPFSPKKAAGAAAADAALNSGVTACVAFNDLLAIGMLMRLRERGVSVPEQLSIVGCDDIFGADFCNPPLTTLTAPIEQAGRVAVSMLLARLDSTTVSGMRDRATLPTHLTVRASTGPVPHERGRP